MFLFLREKLHTYNFVSRLSFLAILLFVAQSCGAGGGNDSKSNLYIGYGAMKVCETFPQHGQTNVPLDSQIVVTFDRIVDPDSLWPENFILVDDSGNPFDLGSDSDQATHISSMIVQTSNPNCIRSDGNNYVSQIRITPSRMFSSRTKYMFGIRDSLPTEEEGTIDPDLIGVQSIDNPPAKLPADGFGWVSGDSYSPFNDGQLRVVSISIGRPLTNGGDTNRTLGQSLLNAINQSPRAAITVTFSEPVYHVINGSPGNFGEVFAKTKLTSFSSAGSPQYNLSGNGMFVMDTQTPVGEIFAKLPKFNGNQLDQTQWKDFVDSKVLRPLDMSVESSDNRTFIFSFDQNCTDAARCFYPDNESPQTATQAWTMVLSGWRSKRTNKELEGGVFVGGGINFSGFKVASQFPNVQDWIQGGFGNAAILRR